MKHLSEVYYKHVTNYQIEDDALIVPETIIDEGFLLEVYCNPDGKESTSGNGSSVFIFFDKEFTIEELLMEFKDYSLLEDEIAINIIDNASETEKELARNSSEYFSK